MKTLKKAIKTALCFVGATLLAGSLYIGAFYGCQKISDNISPKINSESQLESMLKEESKRADIGENVSIKIMLNAGDEGNHSYAEKLGEAGGVKCYEIGLRKGAHVSDLKHELYHIVAGHLESDEESFSADLKYFFWYEPQATIYELTGLKP